MAERVSSANGANGSNTSDEVILLHSRQVTAALRELQAAEKVVASRKGEYRAKLKLAKADGIDTKQLIAAINDKDGDTDMADLGLRNYARYRALLSVPVKFNSEGQGGWDFESDVSEDVQHEQDSFTAHDAGLQAGLKSHGLDTNPHQPGTELHQDWSVGWAKGQKQLLENGPQPETATKVARGSKKADSAGATQH